MLWFVKTFWKSLGFIGGFIGLLYLASDIMDVPDALAGWRRVFAMIDQNTALWIFSVIAIFYIVWIDARPFVTDLFYKRDKSLEVSDHILWKTVIAPEIEGKLRYINIAYVQVVNASKSQSTIDDIRIAGHSPFDRFHLQTEDGKTSVSLNHGEMAAFRLLSFYGSTAMGLAAPKWEVNFEDEINEGSEINLKNGHHNLRFAEKFNFLIPKPECNQASNLNDLLHLRLSAKNQSAEVIELAWQIEKLVREGDYFESPISVAGVTKA